MTSLRVDIRKRERRKERKVRGVRMSRETALSFGASSGRGVRIVVGGGEGGGKEGALYREEVVGV